MCEKSKNNQILLPNIIIIISTSSTQWQQTSIPEQNQHNNIVLVYSNFNDVEMNLKIIRTMYNKHLNVNWKKAILVLFQGNYWKGNQHSDIRNASLNELEMT